MSISPPSDIVLDVARAADPVRLREASQRLDRTRTAEAAGAFTASLAAAEKAAPTGPRSQATVPVAVVEPRSQAAPAAATPKPQSQDAATAAYRDFEAMVLANLFEVAMPKDSDLFGSGTAGGVWSSLFVQEIGKAVAGRGGVGIADALARDAGKTTAGLPAAPSVDAAAITARMAVGLLESADADTDPSIWGTP